MASIRSSSISFFALLVCVCRLTPSVRPLSVFLFSFLRHFAEGLPGRLLFRRSPHVSEAAQVVLVDPRP